MNKQIARLSAEEHTENWADLHADRTERMASLIEQTIGKEAADTYRAKAQVEQILRDKLDGQPDSFS